MSTFKVQPVYAELLLGWLDAAYGELAKHSIDDVLGLVSWQFKGGTLGDYPMKHPTTSSESSFPCGTTASILASDEFSRDRRALMTVLRIRRAEASRSFRSHADWTYSFAVTRALHSSQVLSTRSPSTVFTGLHAVYIVCRRLWEAAPDVPAPPMWEHMCGYITESSAASAAGSMLYVPDVMAQTAVAVRALTRSRVPAVLAMLERVKEILSRSGSQECRQRARCAGKVILSTRKPVSVLEEYPAVQVQMGPLRMHVMHGCAVGTCGDNIVALSRSDLIRLHQFLTGLASGVTATLFQAAIAPGAERGRLPQLSEALDRQVERLLDASTTVSIGDEVQVCKGFKRAFTYYLGTLAGPLSAVEAQALWAETLETPYVSPVLLEGWVAQCRGWSAGTAFNIGKLYKLCPAPDASPAATLVDRHRMVTNRNTATPEALADFSRILRDQILRAYIRKPGVRLDVRRGIVAPSWIASYRAGRFDEVPTSSIHENLAWEGTAEMPHRVADDPAVWKDSGLGWDTVEEAFDPSRTPTKGNMLVRMITDAAAPMPGTAHMRGPHHHKIDTKPEGHKDPSRGIYSGNLHDRLDQSWMEQAVQAVAKFHPAFMVGADTATREERVRAIVSRNMHSGEADVYYSFDVAGWSPRMDPQIQEASHAVWRDLYDSDLFASSSAINCDATIYMNKAGFQGWYKNPGSNLEGYNGKEMTMVLVALMARAVEQWRKCVVRKGLATAVESSHWAAVLLAYIDDGLAKITLPRDRSEALFSEFQACTVASFSECGFDVEVSKCFPSDRFAIFLNEPYLGGRHVVHGTRAAMTICAENVEVHTSLLERVTAVSTGCRGAVMSGLDAVAGVMLQAYHVFLHIREWVRRPSPVAAAIWSFAPRAWGGLGLPTALQLGTSGGGSASEEGVQTLQKWARISRPCETYFLSCARSELRHRTSMGVLVSPLGGELAVGPMIESRVPDAVRAGLMAMKRAGGLSPLARSFLSYSSGHAMEQFADRVVPTRPGQVLQEQVLGDLATTHPHHLFSVFAKRIEKSSTLISLVGPREMRRIIRENKRDAAASYQTARLRCIAT